MDNKTSFGREGEDFAVNYLRQNGYEILDRNWRFGPKEIDIIATKDNTLIIVEVKTRSGDIYEQPEDAVNRRKQRFLISAANEYVLQKNFDCDVRFDIIAITYHNNKPNINHIEDAFYPML